MFLLFCIIEHENMIFPWSKFLQLNLLVQKLFEILESLSISGPSLFVSCPQPPGCFIPPSLCQASEEPDCHRAGVLILQIG